MVPAALSAGAVVGDAAAPAAGRGRLGARRQGRDWESRLCGSTANAGVHPKSGKSPPQPAIRYCCTIEKIVVVIQ